MRNSTSPDRNGAAAFSSTCRTVVWGASPRFDAMLLLACSTKRHPSRARLGRSTSCIVANRAFVVRNSAVLNAAVRQTGSGVEITVCCRASQYGRISIRLLVRRVHKRRSPASRSLPARRRSSRPSVDTAKPTSSTRCGNTLSPTTDLADRVLGTPFLPGTTSRSSWDRDEPSRHRFRSRSPLHIDEPATARLVRSWRYHSSGRRRDTSAITFDNAYAVPRNRRGDDHVDPESPRIDSQRDYPLCCCARIFLVMR